MTPSDLARWLQTEPIEVAKLAVSVVALIGTAVAAVVAIKTFRRSELWKRAEFLASEMKEFLSNPKVNSALLLIDWGSRRIPLLDEKSEDQGRVRVTRPLQVSALLPHTLLYSGLIPEPEQSSFIPETNTRRYSPEEAAIRDCYDAFLDGLERFSSYVQTGLVAAQALRPYVGYWIDDIHAGTADPEDAAWAAALLTYIEFYRFKGVQTLFAQLGRDISPNGAAYCSFLRAMEDQGLATRLAEAIGIRYAGGEIG